MDVCVLPVILTQSDGEDQDKSRSQLSQFTDFVKIERRIPRLDEIAFHRSVLS